MKRPVHALAALVAGLAVFTACTATVSGNGAVSPSPSTHLSCPDPVVTAAGAPFCYALPANFADSSQPPGYGTGWRWRTLVNVAEHDLIEVLGDVYTVDTDKLDATHLRSFYARRLLRVAGRGGILRTSAPEPVEQAGARGYTQLPRFTDGAEAQKYALFRGRTVVLVSCQSQREADEVAAACQDVFRSLVVERR